MISALPVTFDPEAHFITFSLKTSSLFLQTTDGLFSKYNVIFKILNFHTICANDLYVLEMHVGFYLCAQMF